MEAGVAQALGGEPVDGRRPDRRAVAAEIGKPDIVEQHDEDVGRALRRLGRLRPPGFGAGDRLVDGAAEWRAAARAHACLPVSPRPRLTPRFESPFTLPMLRILKN